MPASSQLITRALQLASAGKTRDAQALLRAVLEQDRTNEPAWLAYLDTLTSDRARLAALEHWLRIDPHSQRARQARLRLQTRQGLRRRHAGAQARAVATVGQKPMLEALLEHQVSVHTAAVAFAIALVLVLGGTIYLAAHSVLADRYAALRGKHDVLVQAHTVLAGDHNALMVQHQSLDREHHRLQGEYSALSARHSSLARAHTDLAADYQTIFTQHADLTQKHNAVVADYTTLSGQHEQLQRTHSALKLEHSALKSKAIAPPYIYVHGRTISIAFAKQDSVELRWEFPFESLERDITRGYVARERVLGGGLPTIRLNADSGATYTVTDYRDMVDPSAFTAYMADLYAQAENDGAFIREVWHLVGQLASYTAESENTPRFPLETLLAGGGDCEDTSILFASMIKAAPVDWAVDLVYMDIDHPTAPEDVNHVIVRVSTGQSRHLVETTSPSTMEPYHDGVSGWFLEVN